MQGLPWAKLHTIADECFVGGRLFASEYLVATISLVGKERMPGVLHMSTYLVCASCFQSAFHQGYRAKALKYSPVCDGMLAHFASFGEYRHAQSVFRVAPDVAYYCALVLWEWSPNQCVVQTSRGMIEELLAKRGLGFGCLGNDEKSAGVFVDTVHESYLGVVRVIARVVFQMPCQCVDQGAAKVTTSGMHHHAGWLVDEQQLVVFVYNIQGNLLRYYFPIAFWAVEHQCDDVSGLNLVVALYGFAIGLDVSCLGCLLDAIAAGISEVIHQEFVHSHRILPTICHYSAMLI